MKQNVDYEMIPSEEDHWHIRILTGEFVETVIGFGKLQLVNDQLKYNFDVIDGPQIDLDPETNEGLQKVAGAILYDVLEDLESK